MDAVSARGRLRSDVPWRAIGKFLLVVAVAALGATAGLLLAGGRTEQVGPLIVHSSVVPSLTGDSVIEVPPLGTITLDSHDGPLRLQVQVQGIDANATQGLLAGSTNIGTRDQIVSDVRGMLVRSYLQALVASMLGAAGLVLLVWRRPRRALIVGGVTCALLLGAGGVGAATWNSRALAQPRYTGLLVYAPTVVGNAGEVFSNFQVYGDQLASLVSNVSKLSSTLTSLPTYEPDPNTIRVLWVSDIHLNPNVWPIMRTIIAQYHVDAVADTGDVADHGTSAEAALMQPIGSLPVPYVYVRGNHDSQVIQDAVASQPNAVVLDGNVAKVAGLRFLGSSDPRFTPDKNATSTSAAVVQQGDALAATARSLAHPPDVVMVHDPTAAPPLIDLTPLILAGHVHSRSAQQLDANTLLLVQGSTGGAGLRALQTEQPTPLTFTVLYFNRSTHQLQARDEITLGGLGTSSAEVTRILSQPAPTGSTP